MFCPSASIIAPALLDDEHVQDIEMMQTGLNSNGSMASLRSHPMMQLILPASELNLLNGDLEQLFKENMDEASSNKRAR